MRPTSLISEINNTGSGVIRRDPYGIGLKAWSVDLVILCDLCIQAIRVGTGMHTLLPL